MRRGSFVVLRRLLTGRAEWQHVCRIIIISSQTCASWCCVLDASPVSRTVGAPIAENWRIKAKHHNKTHSVRNNKQSVIKNTKQISPKAIYSVKKINGICLQTCTWLTSVCPPGDDQFNWYQDKWMFVTIVLHKEILCLPEFICT